MSAIAQRVRSTKDRLVRRRADRRAKQQSGCGGAPN